MMFWAPNRNYSKSETYLTFRAPNRNYSKTETYLTFRAPDQNYSKSEWLKFILTIPSEMYANCHECLLMQTNDIKLSSRPTYMYLKLELKEIASYSCINAVQRNSL